jgi:hypothetical protein
MKILIFEYAILAIVCLFEKKFNIGLYWFGAVILNIAVLRGLK